MSIMERTDQIGLGFVRPDKIPYVCFFVTEFFLGKKKEDIFGGKTDSEQFIENHSISTSPNKIPAVPNMQQTIKIPMKGCIKKKKLLPGMVSLPSKVSRSPPHLEVSSQIW